MSHENTFAVSRFLNRNGVTSWRVAGWLHGVRIRKNFKTKEVAAAEKAAPRIEGHAGHIWLAHRDYVPRQ